MQEPPDDNPAPVLQPTPPVRSLVAGKSATDPAAALSQAQVLQQAALAGQAQPLLKGKKLGLLCE
ncbi:MAG TPA: hypothetical protein VFL86_28555, partial [Burkholderiaceae bacterium]|nr:hypothetical protein [Burkholderiaceae bacterium]